MHECISNGSRMIKKRKKCNFENLLYHFQKKFNCNDSNDVMWCNVQTISLNKSECIINVIIIFFLKKVLKYILYFNTSLKIEDVCPLYIKR